MTVQGVPISSFSEVTRLKEDDLLLVTVPTDQNCKFYDNRKISYEEFSNQIMEQMLSLYQLGTMAQEVSSNYAKINHNHDNLYDKTVVTRRLQNGRAVATFLDMTNNGDTGGYDLYSPYKNVPPILGKTQNQIRNQVTVTIPNCAIYKADEPYIGEIKMVAERTKRNILTGSPDFDGWVYADGSSYPKANFPTEVTSVFDEDPNHNTMFVVPTLSDFIKIANGNENVSQHVDGTEVIGNHRHETAIFFGDKQYNGIISCQGTSDYNVGSGGHNSTTDQYEYKCELILEIDSINFSGQTETKRSDSDTSGPTHPTYNSIPTMIYIGKRVV